MGCLSEVDSEISITPRPSQLTPFKGQSIGPIISESTNQRLHSDPKQEVKVLKLLVAGSLLP